MREEKVEDEMKGSIEDRSVQRFKLRHDVVCLLVVWSWSPSTAQPMQHSAEEELCFAKLQALFLSFPHSIYTLAMSLKCFCSHAHHIVTSHVSFSMQSIQLC
jgi:hypothetical protein